MNLFIAHGRLVRDPEMRQTNSGIAVANFTIAVDRKFSKEEKQADFIDCVAWQKTGELIGQYFTKGKEIIVQGRLESRKWVDKEEKNRISWEVTVEQFDFCGSKSDAPSSPSEPATTGFIDVAVDDDDFLPF